MADDKNESRNENEYIGDVLKPKQRKYRKREKIIAAVTIVAFAILASTRLVMARMRRQTLSGSQILRKMVISFSAIARATTMQIT